MVLELLRDNSSQQFHLVKLEQSSEKDECAAADEEEAAAAPPPPAKKKSAKQRADSFVAPPVSPSSPCPTLRLQSSMSLGLITFKWTFHLHSYGGTLEQATFLRNQMYMPMCQTQQNTAQQSKKKTNTEKKVVARRLFVLTPLCVV